MQSFLDGEFPGKVAVSISETECGTGAFEVTANGTLIHSKLTMGQGKCQSDEELDAILDKVGQMTG